MKREEFYKELGKYLLDVSKLIFGGVVLASILKIEDLNRATTISVGITSAIILAIIGFKIIRIK